MSTDEPVQFAAYTPPPPPPSAPRSPWLYAGLGCGALALLLFGGCFAGVLAVRSRVRAEMHAPVDMTVVAKSMADLPAYPGAALDRDATKLGRTEGVLMRLFMRSQTMTAAGYVTQDSMDKVSDFYDASLTKSGFKPLPAKRQMELYQKGQDVVGVQESPRARHGAHTVFLIFHFGGVKAKLTE